MSTLRFLFSLALITCSQAGEYFLEAENFDSKAGWQIIDGSAAREASGLHLLSGATGDAQGDAITTVTVKDAGRYHVWVRYSSHPKWRGPFHLSAYAGEKKLGEEIFDAKFEGTSARDKMTWRSFEVDLPEGEVTLHLSKHLSKNSAGPSRLVDCVLLTMDAQAKPNHLNYGAQTFVRVTLHEDGGKPSYIHIFADHFHADWYEHWSLGRNGPVKGISVKKADMLRSGEATAWCNLTPTIYQDSGATLYITSRHAYTEQAPRLKARIDFATAADEKNIVRSYEVDNAPASFVIYTPPNLVTKDNQALMQCDLEVAEKIGRLADQHLWPTHGKKPEKFPFFVSASIHRSFSPFDARVLAREEKTLGYFGFNERPNSHIGGAWLMKDKSYCLPDIDKMRATIQRNAAAFKQAGGKVGDIVFCELTDEPTGQPLDLAATMPSYAEPFRAWLKSKKLTPESLLVNTWEDVRIVTPAQRAEFPALYYWSQLFRTRALGDFMTTQGKMVHEIYGGDFPVLANFSDGAVYAANFCLQGVNYFELLDSPDQNAIWGEDWSNGASSYQCASYNVDLMRAAARERGQKIAHHLVAHAGRLPWDVKLKATSEVARGVKIFNNFCYGPVWASHEGGPWFRSHLWHGKPETWSANAAITREIGAAEDLLLPAMPAPAQVALLYSTASDVWTIDSSHAFGFDRIHTWMALTHAQMPVDIVAERQIERGQLARYQVCYLTGPNLTRAAAQKLKAWVQAGGTLFLTAGAAMFDEYNRPLHVLDDLLPAQRSALATLQSFQASGRYIDILQPKDSVTWSGGKAEVLCVKQSLTAKQGAETCATFSDGSAAMVRKGRVTVCGFLPALSYIKTALVRRKAAVEAKHPLTVVSYNPWEFPADVRNLLLAPTAAIPRPVECSHALVDAVYMPSAQGIVIPLANYTLEPIAKLHLRVQTPKKIARVESAVQGKLPFKQKASCELELPLANNDFVMLWFDE